MSSTAKWKDLDLSFTKSSLNGDVLIKSNDESIKQHINLLLNIGSNELPYYSNLGSGIQSLLFSTFTPLVKNTLEKMISMMIRQYEPRISLGSVVVTYNANQLTVDFQYKILQENREVQYKTFIKKVR